MDYTDKITDKTKNDKTKNMISLKKVLLSIQWNFDSVIILEPGNMVMRAFDMHKKSTYGRVYVRDYTKTCNFKVFFLFLIAITLFNLCIIYGSRKIPPGKIPNWKILTHQIPPWKILIRKIPTQKIPTWNIPTHFINCLSSCTSPSLDKNL